MRRTVSPTVAASILLTACGASNSPARSDLPVPTELVDLGALVTEDLPERVWGRALLTDNGWYERQNEFEVDAWEQQLPGGTVSGSNSYYTFFNHGGPHVDAPNHVGLAGGLDSYSLQDFVGPLKVFDVSSYPFGRSVGRDFFVDAGIEPGDVVLIYTAYQPPRTDEDYPQVITLTREAAEYLAGIPVRAIATDAMSLEDTMDASPVDADTALALAAPIHESFLSESIPIYEQLFNVEQLLDREDMLFLGVPLNIANGDGMIVRPVVMVF